MPHRKWDRQRTDRAGQHEPTLQTCRAAGAGPSVLLWLLPFWAVGMVIRLTRMLSLPKIAGMPMVIVTAGARSVGLVVP